MSRRRILQDNEEIRREALLNPDRTIAITVYEKQYGDKGMLYKRIGGCILAPRDVDALGKMLRGKV